MLFLFLALLFFLLLCAPLLDRCLLADSTANHHSDVVIFYQSADVPALSTRVDCVCVKFKIPIRPREYAIVMDAIPRKVLCLLKNDCNENPNLDYITNSIFIGNINIKKKNIPNKYIRNLVNYVTYPPARFFWSSIFGDLNWRKAWRMVDKFFVNNKVKEVS